MRNRLGRLRAPMAVLAAAALVGLGSAPAYAGTGTPDPVGGLLRTVTGQPSSGDSGSSPLPGLPGLPALPGLPGTPSPGGSGSSGASGAQGSSDVPPPSSDSDSPGHETPDPKAPDHGSATVTHAAVGGNDVADLGQNTATTRHDDSTKADSTILALGGQEILGTHADSRKNGESHFGDPLKPVCDNSGGAICLQVLYADAIAKDNGSTSHSLSRSGIANACIGGDSTDSNATCDGPVALGVGRSSAESQRNQRTGRTTASSRSDLANVCLSQPGGTGGCALGADAAHSQGQADSGGAKPSASRSSSLLGLTAGGKKQGSYETPTAIAIQPGCASPSLLCAYLNQGETYLGKQLAGTAQDSLVAGVLPGTPVEIGAGLSHSETLVHNDGGEAAGGPTGSTGSGAGPVGSGAAGGPGHPGSSLGALGGVLPNTGGIWSGILAAGLGAVGLGALLMASARRRAGSPA